MKQDLWLTYENMLKSRLFEKAVADAWKKGMISGEMHLSVGEEAIVAGTVLHLEEGDAMALDHRGTAPLVMRGLDLESLFLEFLGHPSGLCKGNGGHMHLFSRSNLSASSGIVGASGPTAAGFALAAKHRQNGKLALAFFGEGAMNQGMLLESMNLAVAWKLPVIFICKDNKWAITTVSASVTGGKLVERARSFKMPAEKVDGSDVHHVWKAAKKAVNLARKGRGPSYIHATCRHPEGHFLGDPLIRVVRKPVSEGIKVAGPLMKSIKHKKGASLVRRSMDLASVSAVIGKTTKDQALGKKDPIKKLRRKLKSDKTYLNMIEEKVKDQVEQAITGAIARINISEETIP